MKNVLAKPLAAVSLGVLLLSAACSWSRFDDATDLPAVAVLHASESTGNVIDVRGATGQSPVLLSLIPRTSSFYSWQVGDPETPSDKGATSDYEREKPRLPDGRIDQGAGAATLNGGSVAYIGPVDSAAAGGSTGECWVHGFRARPHYDHDSTGFAVTCLLSNNNARESVVSNIHPDLNNSPARGEAGAAFDAQHLNDAVWRTVQGAAVGSPDDKFLFPNLASFASWSGGHFAVGTPDIDRAFVYVHGSPGSPFDTPAEAWGSEAPIALEPGADGAATRSFGAAIATIPAAPGAPGSIGIAIAEPVSGKIFLYDIDTTTRASKRRGCISGEALSGIVLHGYADNGKRLIAASNAAGKVALYDFDAVTSEACAAAPPLATLSCSDSADVTGCSDGAFGFSLTHGDLDGDGDQELLVGAPGMNAREKVNAGAVYVYDLESFSPIASDVLFLGNPKNGSLLGTSVTTMRSGNRDVPVASAPGSRDVMVFYCGSLSKASPRCQ